MKILPFSEDWPEWVREAYPDFPTKVLAQADEPDDPDDYIIVMNQIFNARIARIDRQSATEHWCYPSFGDAMLALLSWDGKGNPDDKWIRHGNARTGVLERRHPVTGEVFEDDGDAWESP